MAERLAHYVTLTPSEEEALGQLEQQERSFRRGATVRGENDLGRELFIVQKGWLYSCVLLSNGSRQIMRFHFPGDVVGVTSLAFGRSIDSITAVTDAVLCPFDKDRLATVFEEHPRLSALIFSISLAERASLADRLASVGRTSARARVASLLCELLARLRVTGGADLLEFHVPLTQEEIGDATGLTAVHVNRMMRSLVDDGLIARNGSTIRILDEARLTAEVNFINRYAQLDTSWLPGAR
ncbi:MAG TPA: Crp/Fnr family transcriptional regulator [Allosphingosinicella sp.]|uniref:Crp/Fnr family transcriptional regulator n=1 Tax=Allosphingosinicella sp. TaxID=2823234 RepID=UPI002EDB2E01